MGIDGTKTKHEATVLKDRLEYMVSRILDLNQKECELMIVENRIILYWCQGYRQNGPTAPDVLNSSIYTVYAMKMCRGWWVEGGGEEKGRMR